MGDIAVSGRLRRSIPLILAAAVLSTAGAGAPTAFADEPAAEAGASRGTVTVRKGDRGPAVRRVQRRLGLSADGVFGSQTSRGVRRFQRRRGLTADGIVGPITRRALGLRPFSRGSVVHPRSPSGGGAPGGGGAPAGGPPDDDSPAEDRSPVKLPRVLRRIAECESGGDPTAVSPSGRYRGKFQFSRETWEDFGGHGDDPAKASEAHQDRIALRAYRARGTDPWPVCGSQ